MFTSDLVTQDQVIQKYGGHTDTRKEGAIRNAMHRLAVNTGKRIRVKTVNKIPDPLRKENTKDAMWRIWSVRDHDKWKAAIPEEMRTELKKAHPDIILEGA